MFKPGIKIVTTEADNVKKIKECYSSQNYQLLEFQDHLLFYSTCSNCLFLFKDLNASGRRTSLNDSGYHIAFGTKVPGAPTSGKNKVRLGKKTHYHLMLGCHFLYIEKNTVRFLASLLYLPLIYQLNVMNFIMIRFNSSQFCSCFVEVIEKDIFQWTCLHDIL